MKLSAKFDDLFALADEMGAVMRDFTLDLARDGFAPIDIALAKGIEVAPDEIDREYGLLSYEGRQVLLYIQDHGRYVNRALDDASQGMKFHVADCRTLEKMRADNRFERYVVTNDLSGAFFISGFDAHTNDPVAGHADLKVCKNCLDKLNYRGYSHGGHRYDVFDSFGLEEFFSTYSSFFRYLPSQFAGDAARQQYSDDWRIVAGHYKAEKRFECEDCGLDSSEHRGLIHVHHINGNKGDNRKTNLRALCAECHRMQPCHGHMFVSREDRCRIRELRRHQQALRCGAWSSVLKVADPGVEGLARACEAIGIPVPRVGHGLGTRDDQPRAELVWPDVRIAVTIADGSQLPTNHPGWQVWEVQDALDRLESFAARFGREVPRAARTSSTKRPAARGRSGSRPRTRSQRSYSGGY